MTNHFKIRYFFVMDKIKKGEVKIIHCPTKEITADYSTYPLQGKMFWYFRDLVIGISMGDYKKYRLQYIFLARGKQR